ncbi:hypothetical protein LAUMK13_01019 [Mycobacterium innocens]|uniref:Uncharacterized protein n=1 Tax=Mycobacterium innocens TaxID=2341083 RepID=A0A498PR70_9MYCO|nr:hypothetical protein LAUMK13_01019 [Mycobacterium innocens]
MRGHGGVELRGVMVRQADPIAAAPLGGGRGDRTLGLAARFGFGSRFQLHRGAQLSDRGDPGQLRVVLVRSRTGAGRDDAELIQRQPALAHVLGAAGELRNPARDGGDCVRVGRRAAGLPGHQGRHRPRPGSPPQLVAIDLGHDLNNAPINRVALTGQLRQLRKQHLKTLTRSGHHGASGCTRRHDVIIAATPDKSGPPDPRGVCGTNVGDGG